MRDRDDSHGFILEKAGSGGYCKGGYGLFLILYYKKYLWIIMWSEMIMYTQPIFLSKNVTHILLLLKNFILIFSVKSVLRIVI